MVVLLAFGTSLACDMCNCYLGLNPTYNQHAIGVRFRSLNYSRAARYLIDVHARLAHHPKEIKETVRGAISQYELWGRFYPIKKLQIQMTLPYQQIKEKGVTSNFTGNQWGIATALAQYQIFNTVPDSGKVQHRLFAGGGYSQPLELLLNNKTALGSFSQPAFLAIATYIAKKGALGVNVDGVYRASIADESAYKEGNVSNVGLKLFAELHWQDFTIIPTAAFNYEDANYSTKNDFLLPETQATLVYTGGMLDLFYKKIGLSFMFQYSALQHGDVPDQAGWRMNVGFQYAFN